MSMLGMEPIIADVLALLKAGMAAKVSLLLSVDGVSVALPLPDPTSGYHGWLTDPTLLPTYPSILVRRGPRHVVGEKAIGGEYEIENHFAVDIVVFGQDNATLTLQMDRYIRAVCELLLTPQALTSGQCDLVRVGYEEPQLYDRESGDYLQDVPVFFTCTTYETPPDHLEYRAVATGSSASLRTSSAALDH